LNREIQKTASLRKNS